MSDSNSPISEAEALEWFAEMFEEPSENVTATTPREEIAGWDSLGTLTLMAELDERFDINLTEDQLEGMVSISDILNILKEKNLLT